MLHRYYWFTTGYYTIVCNVHSCGYFKRYMMVTLAALAQSYIKLFKACAPWICTIVVGQFPADVFFRVGQYTGIAMLHVHVLR